VIRNKTARKSLIGAGSGGEADGVSHEVDTEDVRVLVAFAPGPDGPAHEVFVLDLDPGREMKSRWDDRRYVDRLDRALLSRSSPPHALAVTRRRSTWASADRRIEVCLRIGRPTPDEPLDEEARAAVVAAFRDILEQRSPGAASPATRSDAIDAARRAVATGWTEPEHLTVTEEEHRPRQRLWVVGLAGPDGTRYRAEVGVVDGDVATVHAVRTAAPEVVDSVGT
jgi:hypothetical protein